MASKSVLAVSRRLLEMSENRLDYVTTYQFSQDLLEIVFSKIWGQLGWNNNPNILQFRYAWSLLHKNLIEESLAGNCTEPAAAPNVHDNDTNTEGDVDPRVSKMLATSTKWRAGVLRYINGYIARKLGKKLTMTDKRLNALGMLSIEKDLIKSIPDFNTKVIERFALLK